MTLYCDVCHKSDGDVVQLSTGCRIHPACFRGRRPTNYPNEDLVEAWAARCLAVTP